MAHGRTLAGAAGPQGGKAGFGATGQLPGKVRAVAGEAQALVGGLVGAACHPTDARSADDLFAAACDAIRPDDEVDANPGLVIESPAMRELHGLLPRVARGGVNVLVLGETGVGKEIVAEELHRLSPRADQPLLRLNCAGFSETLLESELFGHEKGAFTGATQRKIGLLDAHLFFRLNGFSLTIPPLRERGEEILPLAEQFARAAARRMGESSDIALTDAARARDLAPLAVQPRWPGWAFRARERADRRGFPAWEVGNDRGASHHGNSPQSRRGFAGHCERLPAPWRVARPLHYPARQQPGGPT